MLPYYTLIDLIDSSTRDTDIPLVLEVVGLAVEFPTHKK